MKRNKIILISIIAVIAIIILLASYILITIPKENKTAVTEKIENLQIAEAKEFKNKVVTTESWDLNRVNIVNDTEGIPVPVPKGYVASGIEGEHTINTGFVIYEGEEEVTDANKATAQATRNQWVWVPIYDVSQIYGTDANGKKHGKLYSYSDTGRTALNWTESNGVMSISSSTGYREPDIVTNYDNDKTLATYITELDRKELSKELTREFERSMASIEKYGGFYIGRYETGGLSGQAKVVKGDTDIASQNWYTMYTKSKTLNGINENVRTSMIWGSMWDAALEWLVESGSKTYSEVGADSTSWGNYYYSTFTYTNTSGGTSTKSSNSQTRIPTGSSDYTKANNIYDMAGNVWEWTLEANVTYSRVCRGGDYVSYGYSYPADYRNNNSPDYSVLNVRL